MTDQRSTINPVNLQEVLDAAASDKAATLTGQQQYSTPQPWADWFHRLLPDQYPDLAFDPQAGPGHLLAPFYGDTLGWDIDRRCRRDLGPDNQKHRVITGNCVRLWALLDELYPDHQFPCQVANPPFGIQWKVGDDLVDSTEYTWRKLMERTAPGGCGYFVANAKTIERLGLDQHPWVYLYQKFPAGFFPKTVVEPGVVHWFRARTQAAGQAHPFTVQRVTYQTLNPEEHRELETEVYRRLNTQYPKLRPDWTVAHPAEDWAEVAEALARIVQEETRPVHPFNVWLDSEGLIRVYLSTFEQVKRKFSRDEVLRLSGLDRCHPLTLTTEVQTRRLLAELLDTGVYRISPDAAAALRQALDEVALIAAPLMPATDFMTVAYADELDRLTCRPDYRPGPEGLPFTPGQAYPITTGTYRFVQQFSRNKDHLDPETGDTVTQQHHCSLSGTDRFVAVRDDAGRLHRFLDRPGQAEDAKRRQWEEHPDSLLWQIFIKPAVLTVAEQCPELVARYRAQLERLCA